MRRLAAALGLVGLLLGGCAGTDEPPEEDARHCDLLDPETVETIVGDRDVMVFGEPVPQTNRRHIQCTIYVPAEFRNVLLVDSREVGEESMAGERILIEARLDDTSVEHPDGMVTVEEDGAVGYSRVIDEEVWTRILTDTGLIMVSAPVDSHEPADLTALTLEIAQEFDANLTAWDAENPPTEE